MSRPSLFDSFLRYLAVRGYDLPADALKRDVEQPLGPSREVQDVLLRVYRDDGEAAQIAERLVDVDEGVQEWRYRHVKMVERTIGTKPGTGGSSGAAYLRTTLFTPVFPDLWEIRTEL
jgi:tryptophan 2,3-dioxygenase